MLDTLTERQQEIYLFIRDHVRARGCAPSVREIGANFNISSPNGVQCHLQALEKKGLLKKDRFKARAIQVVDPEAQQAEEDWHKLRLTLLWWFGTTDAELIHESMEDTMAAMVSKESPDKKRQRLAFDTMLERAAIQAGAIWRAQ